MKKEKQSKRDPVFGLLGLAARARNLVSGGFETDRAIQSGKACLVILAEDTSARTEKQIRDKCNYRRVPLYRYGTKETLGHAIGQEERSALAVTDSGLAEALEKILLTNMQDGESIEEADGGSEYGEDESI